jgi:hypothetical protein
MLTFKRSYRSTPQADRPWPLVLRMRGSWASFKLQVILMFTAAVIIIVMEGIAPGEAGRIAQAPSIWLPLVLGIIAALILSARPSHSYAIRVISSRPQRIRR